MKRFWLFIFLIPLLFSCSKTLNPSVMFKTDKEFTYSEPDSAALKIQSEYKLSPFDELELHIFSNNGYKLVDITPSSSGAINNDLIKYAIEADGFVKLPLLGRVELKGKTIKEAEKMMEEKYTTYYNSPFVVLKVLNRRVLVFNGEGGGASIVQLTNDNMTLIEAIASNGGIANTGKAYEIKLIRGDLKKPLVYHIDLSTIEGMKQADLQLQANDIIYIEPTRNVSESILVRITPAIGLLTTILLTIAIFTK